MWSEWLARTLRPRRDKAADVARPRDARRATPPELEADGMHPGADEYRSALAALEAEVEG